MFKGKRYFKSRAGRGNFVKLQLLKPDERVLESTKPQQVFKLGSRIQFGRHNECGVITWLGKVDDSDEYYVKIITVSCICTYIATYVYIRIISD